MFCDDHDVVGADFVVMDRRYGEVVRDGIPPSMAHHLDVGRRIGLALVDAMADLHLLDPVDAGVGDLGRPDGFTERQISGWATRWGLVRPDDGPAVMDELADRLAATMPRADARLDRPQRPQARQLPVRPRRPGPGPLDLRLGHDDARRAARRPRDAAQLLARPSDDPMGLPTRDEIIERYAERTGLDVSSAGWYEAFAKWKTAVVIQQLHRRWERGESSDPRMETIADRLPLLAATASALLDRL